MLTKSDYVVRQIKCWALVCALFILSFQSMWLQASDKTPSHAYQLTGHLRANIQLIRDFENVKEVAEIPHVQSNKTPLHVYSKSLEVRTKIIYLQNKYNLESLAITEVPLREISPTDVYEVINQLHEAVMEVKLSLGITQSVDVPFLAGKTSANVYENLWQASYYLDALVGEISADLVYRNMLYAIQDVEALVAKLALNIQHSDIALLEDIKPKQANIEGYKNLYRLARLERKLNIDAVAVQSFPSTVITLSDVFDTTNSILAELIRIKIATGVTTSHKKLALSNGKKPRDLLQKMQILGEYLEIIEQEI